MDAANVCAPVLRRYQLEIDALTNRCVRLESAVLTALKEEQQKQSSVSSETSSLRSARAAAVESEEELEILRAQLRSAEQRLQMQIQESSATEALMNQLRSSLEQEKNELLRAHAIREHEWTRREGELVTIFDLVQGLFFFLTHPPLTNPAS